MAPTDMLAHAESPAFPAIDPLVLDPVSGPKPGILARLTSARGLVALMVSVGIFDLVCTITAYETGVLDEMNPIARAVLDSYGSPGLAVFRFVATALSCIVLVWALRVYRARYAFDHNARRVRTVIHSAVAVIVVAHVSLFVWWVSWLSL